MQTNPFIMRFRNGATYRLRSSPDFPKMLGGTMTVRSEIKPTDQWGNRIFLADFELCYPDGHWESRRAARCFVEEGYATFTDSYGERKIPVEIANLQGMYPYYGKAYAIDEMAATEVA